MNPGGEGLSVPADLTPDLESGAELSKYYILGSCPVWPGHAGQVMGPGRYNLYVKVQSSPGPHQTNQAGQGQEAESTSGIILATKSTP